MDQCQRIRDRLAANGPAALQEDSRAQEHLVECEHCFRFLENLDRLELELGSLPVVDAPDELVARLLDREELADPTSREDPKTRWFLRPLFQGRNPLTIRALVWGSGALASAVLLVGLFAGSNRGFRANYHLDGGEHLEVRAYSPPEDRELSAEEVDRLAALGYVAQAADDEVASLGDVRTRDSLKADLGESPVEVQPSPPRSVSMKKKSPQDEPEVEYLERIMVVAEGPVVRLEDTQVTTKFSEEFVQDLPVPGRYFQNDVTLAPGVDDADGDGNPNVHGSRDRDFKTAVGGVSRIDPLTGQKMSEVNPNSIEEMKVITEGAGAEFSRSQGGFAKLTNPPFSAAAGFLRERANVEPGAFKEATGYWSNTYLPGDPVLRYLRARLQQPVAGLEGLSIHSSAQATQQPFDAPQHAAIALQLQADRRATEGPARTLVQVGIKAIEHLGGRRPAMNLAIVIDAGGDTPDEVATGIRAIVDALNGARRTGDRFRLLIANDQGGVAVDADRFRHGQLRVALARLFSSE